MSSKWIVGKDWNKVRNVILDQMGVKVKPPTYGNKIDWEKCQAFELKWWKKNWEPNKKRDQEFIGKMKKEFDFTEDSFADKIVLDIGAGPRSWPSLLLKKARIIIVEPLASRFIEFNGDYYKLPNIMRALSCPGEYDIERFWNRVDMVWCFNTLNHCCEWKKVIDNIEKYLKVGGKLYMKVKMSEHPHTGHIGVNKDEFFNYMDSKKFAYTNYHDSDETEDCYIIIGDRTI